MKTREIKFSKDADIEEAGQTVTTTAKGAAYFVSIGIADYTKRRSGDVVPPAVPLTAAEYAEQHPKHKKQKIVPVEIPRSLIAKLKGLGPRFCMVYSELQKHPNPEEDWRKRPVGPNWRKNPMYADDPKLQEWLAKGGNYGVVGGSGLVIIDPDVQELQQAIKEKLPP